MIQQHTVQKDKHDFKPGHGLGLKWRKTGFFANFRFPEEAWFNPREEGPIGRDGMDWNKLAGVSFLNPINPRTWAKNRDAALIAWRPSFREGYFDLAAYVNDSKGGHDFRHLLTIPAGKVGNISVHRWAGGWRWVMNSGTESAQVVLPVRHRSMQVNVGPWFGGNRTAPMEHWVEVDLTT